MTTRWQLTTGGAGTDTLHGYSNVSFPKDSILRLAVSYYDSYDFNGSPTFTYDGGHISGMPAAASTNTRGMATGSKVRLLSTTGNVTANWIKGAVFYDSYDRVIQTQSNNHLDLNAVDKSSVLYNNIRRVERTKLTHTAQSVTTHITQRNDYDHAGRVLRTYHQINLGTEVLAAQYEYNALGQLVDKKLHSVAGSAFIQSIDYRYNIRGWLASINNAQLGNDAGTTNDDTGDYFGMELAYNGSVSGLSNTAYYNGNISAVKWKGPGASGEANQRSYRYSYDKSDKLKAATFQAYDSVPATWTKESNTLNETMTYDHGGNILTLARKRNNRSLAGTNTAATVDNLSYSYATNTNMLVSVQDTDSAGWFKNPVSTSSEYAHNSDGSLTRDDNKGISSITYNFLGKPQVVNFTSGKKVEYVYDAAGIKLTMKTWQSTTLLSSTNYTGGFVYEGSTPALSYFSSPEGRVVKNGSSFEYQYAIADHQGNTRVVFTSAAPATQSYTATLESNTQTAEQSNFQNYPTGGNRSSFSLYDHTDTGGSTYSYLLNGGYSSQVGLAKSFKVYPGDKVSIKAFAKYMSSTGSSNLSGFATALLAAFGYGSPPAGGETGTAKAALNSWGGMVAGGNGHEDNEDHPKAFVNLLVFDKNYNLLDMGWDQINGGKQIGASPDVAHDSLFQEYVAREEGWVYAYISNENATLADVYFDDVTLTLTPGRVIQGNEYYPFGVQAATSWTRQSAVANNFLYNGGTELNKTTQVYDLYYRNYDPVLGRFGQVDPMAGKYGQMSPYHFAGNNPVVMNDPLGDEYDAFSVMDGSYVASGRGESVYRDMDPYGRYTTARIMAESIERMSMMRDAQDSELDIADGMHSFVFGSNGEFTYEYKSDQEMLAMIFVYGEDRVRAMYSGTGPIIGNYVGGARLWQAEDGGFVQLKNGLAYVPGTDRRYYGVIQQTQGDPQTWYYMSRDGAPHGMVYDPIGKVIYEVNGVPGQDSWYEQLERLIINSAPSNNVKAKISIAYQYRQSNDAKWSSLWNREAGNTFLLSPVTVFNPAAATAWFQGQTGNAWNYSLGRNNCAHYSVQGLNAGGSGINFSGPFPSSFPIAPTMTWTAGQAYPVPIRK